MEIAMTPLEIQHKAWEEEINNRYSEAFTENKEKPDFMMDGVIDIEKYAHEKIKILYLNREPNDEGADGWLNQDIKNNILNGKKVFPNNGNIVPNLLGAYFLVHELCDDTAKNRNVEDFCKVIDTKVKEHNIVGDKTLLSIAYMNLKKIGGGAKTDDTKLISDLSKGWKVIKKQILGLNPTIIIGGNITDKYLDANDKRIDLEWAKNFPGYLEEKKSVPALHGIIIDGKEFPILDLYHPSYNCNHDKYSWKDCYDLLVSKGDDYWQARFNQKVCLTI